MKNEKNNKQIAKKTHDRTSLRAVSIFILYLLLQLTSEPLKAAPAKAISKTEKTYQNAILQGAKFSRQGDNPRALARFKEAVRLKPRSAQAHYRLALTYCDRSMYMAAEENARKATLLDKDFAPAWLILGTAKFYISKHQEAIEALTKALQLSPKNPHITYMLGRCYYFLSNSEQSMRKNKSKALEFFKQTLRLDPLYVAARFMEGCCFLDLDMADVARDSFIATIRTNSGNAEAYFRLGLCAIKTGRFVEAEAKFRETLRRAPQHYDAHLCLGDLFMKQLPDQEQAFIHYRRFLEFAPPDHQARNRVNKIIKPKKKKTEK